MAGPKDPPIPLIRRPSVLVVVIPILEAEIQLEALMILEVNVVIVALGDVKVVI
jgi:hypothetical protein